MTDREWAVIASLIPPAKPGGWPRKTNIREVVNAILYIAGSVSQWRALPKDFPRYPMPREGLPPACPDAAPAVAFRIKGRKQEVRDLKTETCR
ncbi:transposase [Martelella lutilitoris]|uniref:Transposase n=1 Tax=Martelella lutilitoris TaxID=2583532 RepID=A0A7T7HGL8_9HYPH|nr:transposase [Martelella lutilitoris]